MYVVWLCFFTFDDFVYALDEDYVNNNIIFASLFLYISKQRPNMNLPSWQ